jgi:hypothetical protein
VADLPRKVLGQKATSESRKEILTTRDVKMSFSDPIYRNVVCVVFVLFEKKVDRAQACKFVCLMSDISLSPCLSCLSFLLIEKVIVCIDGLSVDRISSETHDR